MEPRRAPSSEKAERAERVEKVEKAPGPGPTAAEQLQNEQELANICKAVNKASRKLLEDRTAACHSEEQLAIELGRLSRQCSIMLFGTDGGGDDDDKSVASPSDLAAALKSLSESVSAASTRRQKYSKRSLEAYADRHIAKLSGYDFRPDEEVRKTLEAANADLTEHLRKLGQFHKKGKKDPQKLSSLNAEKVRFEAALWQAQDEFDLRSGARAESRHVNTLRALESYLAEEYEYFKRGWYTYSTMTPTLKLLQSSVASMEADSDVIREGVLRYRFGNKIWKRARFVLTRDVLKCFGEKDAHKAEHVFKIRICSVKVAGTIRDAGAGAGADPDKNEKKQGYEFEVVSPELPVSKKGPNKKGFIIAVPTLALRDGWVASFQHAISLALEKEEEEVDDLNLPPELIEALGSKSGSQRNSMGYSGWRKNSSPARASSSPISRRTRIHGADASGPERRLLPADALPLVSAVDGNTNCADCRAPNPDWASINLGITLCLDCSGAHRSLGVHISKVRSLSLDRWDPCVIDLMASLGNRKINSLLAAKVGPGQGITTKTEREARHAFVRKKYDTKEFLSSLAGDDDPRETLFRAIQLGGRGSDEGVILVLHTLLHGAPIDAEHPETGASALMCAGELDKSVIVELLIQFGADPSSMINGTTAIHAAARSNAALALDTMLKTGIELFDVRDAESALPEAVAIKGHATEAIAVLATYRAHNINPRKPLGVMGSLPARLQFEDDISKASPKKGSSTSGAVRPSPKRTRSSSSGPKGSESSSRSSSLPIDSEHPAVNPSPSRAKRRSKGSKDSESSSDSFSSPAKQHPPEHRNRLSSKASGLYNQFRLRMDAVLAMLDSKQMDQAQLVSVARLLQGALVRAEKSFSFLELEPPLEHPPPVTEEDTALEKALLVCAGSVRRLVDLVDVLHKQIKREVVPLRLMSLTEEFKNIVGQFK
jgi:Putative GTPase activating protein for Arf